MSDEFGIPQGAQVGSKLSTSLSLRSIEPFRVAPVCAGKMFCVYGSGASFEPLDLDPDAVKQFLSKKYDALGFPENTIPAHLKNDIPPSGNIKVILEPDEDVKAIMDRALGSGFGHVKYFVYDSVDINSLYNTLMPSGNVNNGPLRFIKNNPTPIVDPEGNTIDDDEIFRLFLFGLIQPPVVIDDPNNSFILNEIGELGISDNTTSPPIRVIQFAVLTNRGPIDPIFLFHRLIQDGYLTDAGGFLSSDVAKSIFHYGSDDTGVGISGDHFSILGLEARDAFINTLSAKYVYPFSWLKILKQHFALDPVEWRTVGTNQKEVYKAQLPQPGTPTKIFAGSSIGSFEDGDLYNIFLLEALLEHYCVEDFDQSYVPIAEWNDGQRYSNGDVVKSTKKDPDDHPVPYHWYFCVKAGLSGEKEPTWPTAHEAKVSDGEVVWQEGELMELSGPKKLSVNLLEGEDIVVQKTARGKVSLRKSDIYLIQIDPFYFLGGQRQYKSIVAKVPPSIKGTELPGEPDDYEGVMWLVAGGEVQQVFGQFSSLTSRGAGITLAEPKAEGAASSIEGNRKYRFRSQHAGNKKGINFAFSVTSNLSIILKVHGRIPGWYYWGDDWGHVEGEEDVDPAAEGKGSIMIHRGNPPGSDLGWHGSHGCQVAPSKIYYRFRDRLIEIWQRERGPDPTLSKIGRLKKRKSEIVWVASRHHKQWEITIGETPSAMPGYTEADVNLQQQILKGAKMRKAPKSPFTIDFKDWDGKIFGTYFLIRPDEFVPNGEAKRKLRRRDD